MALLGHSDLNSTAWYLQDNLVTVDLSALEQAKRNSSAIEQQKAQFHEGTETIQ